MAQSNALQSLDFDWAEPNALGPTFLTRLQRIQAETPIFWSEKQGVWLVTRVPDITAGLIDPRFSNHRMHLLLDFDHSGRVFERYPNFSKAILGWIFNIDAPSHLRLRKLLMRPFSKSQATRYREFAIGAMEQLLDSVEGRDDVEFISELAMPFACRVLLHVLGLSGVITEQQMLRWGMAIAMAFGTSYMNPDASAPAEDAIIEITEILIQEIAKRQAAPTDDLLSVLVQISEDGDRLTEEEIIALFHVLLLAGFETTGHTLSGMMMGLEPLPDRVDHIRTHPDQMPEILDELQRHVALVGAMSRLVRDDMEWSGAQLRKGDLVYFMLCAGNWDETVFPDPGMIDFHRPKVGNVVFAPGLHHCLGHNLAKMQLGAGLEAIYGRYDRVEILNKPLEWTPNFLTRSVSALHVRFHPRAAA